MTDSAIPVLPSKAQLQYLGEGAANIVYRIYIPQPDAGTPKPAELEEYGEGTPPPSEVDTFDGSGEEVKPEEFSRNLLRVRKDLSTTSPCLTAQSSWARLIRPLFPCSQLVNQSLVSLRPGPGNCNHIHDLNASLVAGEPKLTPISITGVEPTARPSKRHGVYLADDEYGLLVTDMSDYGIVQFKPKWLAQSPGAPVGARRCRQCALVARKAFILRSKQSTHRIQKAGEQDEKAPVFCPLDLLSPEKEVLGSVARDVLGDEASSEQVRQFTNWIQTTSLLRRLRDVQVAMDKYGVLAAEEASEELRIAMTVRDCSVFVRLGEVSGEKNGELEARIGDLDVKSPDKLDYWKETERVLVEEGWYGGRVEEGVENDCSLGRM